MTDKSEEQIIYENQIEYRIKMLETDFAQLTDKIHNIRLELNDTFYKISILLKKGI